MAAPLSRALQTRSKSGRFAASISCAEGKRMGKAGKTNDSPIKAEEKPKKPPPPPTSDDEDYEDGDIATPKRDRYGTDDEPL
jgi:hypothetical protein